MMSNELKSLWHNVLDDFQHPDLLWQLAALAICLAAATLAERIVGQGANVQGKVWRIGHGGVKRVVFPLVGLGLVLAARGIMHAQHLHYNLLSIAIPLLGSLAIIRTVFYVLRHSFSGSAWLVNFERLFAALVWMVVALHITGLLPDVIDALDAAEIKIGKQRLSIWLVLQGMITVLATVVGALWIGNAIEARLTRAAGVDDNLRLVLARLIKAVLLLLSVTIALPLVGIDLMTLSVFGGALGVGLGFGLQKIASNYISGFIILLDRSIRIGNLITVGTDRGEVTRITTRYTVLKNLAGIEAIVPNELLVSSVVQNESYSDPKVRIDLPIQIGYDSNLETAMAILDAAARAQPRVLADPPTLVMLKAFGESGVDLMLSFWVADPDQGVGSLRSDINLTIWREFKRTGIVIPYPQREVRILDPKKGTA
ncbi:MAG TPA: mechanosensitive ion channel domain-containing protein [Rhodocyclaceae bacterium]|nr:mechanosensitive ion channel domain-containing protein [Rhodocyclaceae bacterium]